jgi:hypothetical protein
MVRLAALPFLIPALVAAGDQEESPVGRMARPGRLDATKGGDRVDVVDHDVDGSISSADTNNSNSRGREARRRRDCWLSFHIAEYNSSFGTAT